MSFLLLLCSSELVAAAGIVTIFAIVAGCVGANLHPSKVVIIGIGNLLADAISMGFGEFVSSAAEEDFIKSEREREEWCGCMRLSCS